MFRKIHSNRDPRDTIVSELQKEFGKYWEAASRAFLGAVNSRPRWTFACMVTLLLLSVSFSFFYYKRETKPARHVEKLKVQPLNNGFDQILRAGEKLRATLRLKHVVDSITAKKTLTAKDSLTLDSALDRLQFLQKSLK